MKRLSLYRILENVLEEGRYFSEAKYQFIMDNLGELLFNEVIKTPKAIRSIPDIDLFERYLKTKTTAEVDSDDSLILNLDKLGDWLVLLSDSQLSRFTNQIFKLFPEVKKKVDRFDKPVRDPNLPPTRRGRPPGSGVKPPQPIQFTRELSRTPIEQKPEENEPDQPTTTDSTDRPTLYLGPEDRLTKRGRKPVDDGLTAMERYKFKKEGPEMIDKLKTKWSLLDQEVQKSIERINRITDEIEKRKRFFGMED